MQICFLHLFDQINRLFSLPRKNDLVVILSYLPTPLVATNHPLQTTTKNDGLWEIT